MRIDRYMYECRHHCRILRLYKMKCSFLWTASQFLARCASAPSLLLSSGVRLSRSCIILYPHGMATHRERASLGQTHHCICTKIVLRGLTATAAFLINRITITHSLYATWCVINNGYRSAHKRIFNPTSSVFILFRRLLDGDAQ